MGKCSFIYFGISEVVQAAIGEFPEILTIENINAIGKSDYMQLIFIKLYDGNYCTAERCIFNFS